MKQFLRFKEWAEQERIQRILNKLILGWVIVLLMVFVVLGARNDNVLKVLGVSTQVKPSLTPTNTPTPTESPTPIPTDFPTDIPEKKPVYVDPDPIVTCNIHSNCGGGTRQMKKSECDQSTCCQIGNGWSMYPNKTACTQAQNNYGSSNNYPTCTVYYSLLKTTSTYNGLSNEECAKLKNDALNPSSNTTAPNFTVTPLPTVAPYQYSQEYLDAMEKANQEMSKPYQPSQFVAPTQKCYSTWDEYFNAHPNYAPQHIAGMSGTPPCD